MPRKAKEFKGTILRLEGLSDPGKPTPQPQRVEYDDFTGEPIPIATPEPKSQPIASDHRKLKREADIQAAREGLSMLVRLGIEKNRPDPIPREIVPKGMRKIAELDGKAVLVPLKPWRRM